MRKMGREMIKRGIAIGLMALMACVNPLQTSSPLNGIVTEARAAEADAPYVGEVRLAVDKKADKAKQILSDAGYEVIDQDLNEEAGSFWNDLGDQAVYMGIKRTDNEKKAIRDMKTMNMLGKYSYSDLEEWVENNRQTAKEKVKPVLEALKEYRANVRKGDPVACMVKDTLNAIKEDDSGKTIGDLFLDETCDEEVLVKLLVEGNGEIMDEVLRGLTMSLESEEDTWLDRLSGITKKSLTKEYTRELYGVDQVTGEKKEQVERLMNSEYDELARKILSRWDEIRELIVDTSYKPEVTMEDFQRMVEEGFEQGQQEFLEKTTLIRNNAIVDTLKEIPYNGKTLLDLFKVNRSTLSRDITLLYPVVAALSPGQRAMFDFLSLDKLMEYTMMRKSAEEKDIGDLSDLECVKELRAEMTEVSVYEGVDRAVYKEGAAMTSRATEAMKSGESDDERTLRVVRGTTAILAGIFLFTSVVCSLVNNVEYAMYAEMFRTMDRAAIAAKKGEKIAQFKDYYDSNVSFSRYMLVGSIIMAIVSVTTYIIEQVKEHNKKQLPIPTIMVDRDVASSITGNVVYQAVLWNRDRQDDSGRDDRGDLNGDAGDQWLALYTTTDKSVGDPILADSILAQTGLQNGKQIPGNDYVPLTMFGMESVQNLVEFSYNDEVRGIWVWYKKGVKEAALIDGTEEGEDAKETSISGSAADTDSDSEAGTTGSNIGSGTMALGITGGAVGGFLIGVLCMYFIRRKKTVPEKKDAT